MTYKLVLGILVGAVAGFCIYTAFSESNKAENLLIHALVEADKLKLEAKDALAQTAEAIAVLKRIRAMTPFEFAQSVKPGPENIETICDGKPVFLVGPGAKAANMQVIR